MYTAYYARDEGSVAGLKAPVSKERSSIIVHASQLVVICVVLCIVCV